MQLSEHGPTTLSSAEQTYSLRLYVAGQTPKSVLAFKNLKQICEQHLLGRYDIEIVDLLENPQLARGDQILAVPDARATAAGTDQEDHRRSLEHRARARRAGSPCTPVTGS